MTKPERLGVITVGVVQRLSPRITFFAVNIKDVHPVPVHTVRKHTQTTVTSTQIAIFKQFRLHVRLTTEIASQ